jgi:hypothetical protein
LLRRTGVPSTLSLAIKRAVSRTMTSGPTVAVIITSLQNADTGKTTASDGKFRQDFAKKTRQADQESNRTLGFRSRFNFRQQIVCDGCRLATSAATG